MKSYITFKETKYIQQSLFDQNSTETLIKSTTVYWKLTEESIQKFKERNEINRRYLNTFPENIEKTYSRFKIPKQSGGSREIEAPIGLLKCEQARLNVYLQKACNVHDGAYAYVKGRSAKDCVTRHKENKSKYFLHLDLKDFFGSCTREFVFAQLKQIMPFCLFDENILKHKLEIAFKETDGLPQGAPTSPVLSNIIMIPIDYKIEKMLREFKNDFVYTRYADDIIISNKNYFNPASIIKRIETRLQGTPLQLNPKKTHFGTNAGKNWILGMMLNRNNDITIGHSTKEAFRSYTFKTLLDLKSGTLTSQEAYQYLGICSYYNDVEKQYVPKTIEKYAKKLNINPKTDYESVRQKLISLTK